MAIIYKYATSYVIDNTSYEIDVVLLGKTINKWLKDLEETQDDELTRCNESGGYIVICPYGSLGGRDLLEFLRSFLKVCKISFEYAGNLPDELAKVLPNLPKTKSYREGQFGGDVNDTDDIDRGVQPLCDALNSIPFVETFSSCEGHIKHNSGTLYVLFTIQGQNRFYNLEKLTILLDEVFDKVWDEFNLNKEMIFPQFLFNRGTWPGLEGIYFEIRMMYNGESKDILFLAIDKLSTMIKETL